MKTPRIPSPLRDSMGRRLGRRVGQQLAAALMAVLVTSPHAEGRDADTPAAAVHPGDATRAPRA